MALPSPNVVSFNATLSAAARGVSRGLGKSGGLRGHGTHGSHLPERLILLGPWIGCRENLFPLKQSSEAMENHHFS